MEESYREGPASHPDPESCVDGREAGGEALTGAHAGQPSSCEIRSFGMPTPLFEAEGHTGGGVMGEPFSDPAQSETLCMRGNSLCGNREIPTPTPPEGNALKPFWKRLKKSHAKIEAVSTDSLRFKKLRPDRQWEFPSMDMHLIRLRPSKL